MGTIMASERSASVRAKAKALFAIPVVVVLLIAPDAWASTGAAKLWVARYNGPANGSDFALSLAASPDGTRVFVTGLSTGTTGNDYGTVAYDAATGVRAWVRRYNGPGNGDDNASSVAVSADGSKIFVTGSSLGTAGFFDYATLSYDAASGARLWVRRFNGAGTGGGEASSVVTSPDGSKVFVTGHSTVHSGATVFATVAYSAATGARLWVGRYNGPGAGGSFPSSLAASSDGSKVFVTGYNKGDSGGDYDYATVAYEAATGAKLWAKRYNGPANGTDAAFSVASSPDASTIFVTGNSLATSGSFDYATVAYSAATGARCGCGATTARETVTTRLLL
jgi:WD40 repeat protein